MTNPNAVATRRQTAVAATKDAPSPRDQLKAALSRFESSFAKVLPATMTPERIVTLTLVAATKTPKLFDCSPESIALSVMRIAQWGLEIGTTAHLVPFKGQCTAIADWKGLVELMIRSGHVRDVRPRAVFANEHFVVRYGVDETIEHHPLFGDTKTKGELTHAYAVAALRNNRATFEVMSRAEIEAIRLAGPMPNSDAWKNHYVEMSKKTVVRRIAKRLPQTPVLRDVLDADERLAAAEAVDARPALDGGHLARRLVAGTLPANPEYAVGEADAAQARANGEAMTRGEVPTRVVTGPSPVSAAAREWLSGTDPYTGEPVAAAGETEFQDDRDLAGE